MHLTRIIKTPVLTEKSYAKLGEGYYTFLVDIKASKPQIKAAFETIFEVKVDKVNTIKSRGHKKRMGRYIGRTARTKRAIIKLKAGETLDLFNEKSDKSTKTKKEGN